MDLTCWFDWETIISFRAPRHTPHYYIIIPFSIQDHCSTGLTTKSYRSLICVIIIIIIIIICRWWSPRRVSKPQNITTSPIARVFFHYNEESCWFTTRCFILHNGLDHRSLILNIIITRIYGVITTNQVSKTRKRTGGGGQSNIINLHHHPNTSRRRNKY